MSKKSMSPEILVEKFDPLKESDEEWKRFHEYRRKKHMEVNPNDPVSSDASVKNSVQQNVQNPEFGIHLLSIIDKKTNKQVGDALQGLILEASPSYEGTKHLIQFDIFLLSSYRRKGIGSRLLKQVYDFAIEHNKTLLVTDSSDEDGKAFLKAIGAQVALSGVDNRLQLSDVDWDMIESWAKEGPKRSAGTILDIVQKIPDEILEEYCKVYTEVTNQQPLGELDVGAIVFTPDSYRTMEEMFEKMNRTWITIIAKEPNGKISGLTEMRYNPERKTMISQILTGVQQDYRGRGIGKWLKAAMLLYVREKYPEINIVTTGNATTNKPMLSINDRLGFKVHKETVNAQITVDQLTNYFNSL
ncbi:MAG: GNAT family N-acetyltransferase [Asgard group archaeon]|nr:GNAT family N-acetyltransferase [Asgard group archaeon]